jgi:hypothetical protein
VTRLRMAGGLAGASPRTKRDRYLGAAALLLGVCELAFILSDAILISLFRQNGGWAVASWSVEACRFAFVTVGLSLAGLGFLGSVSGRARMIRAGAYCIAVSYVLAAAATILYGFQHSLDAFVHLYHGLQIVLVAARVAALLAALWVAWAFSAKLTGASSEVTRTRNLRLGWAAAFFACDGALWIAVHMLNENEWHFWARGLPLRSDLAFYFFGRLGGDVMWVVAAALAAVGFFLAARRRATGTMTRLALRERLLAYASALFALSAVLYVVANISVRWFHPFTNWKEAAYSWIDWLAGAEGVLPGVLAAIGFSLSQRSLRGGCEEASSDVPN